MDWSRATQSMICVFGTTGLESPAAKYVMLLLHPGSDYAKVRNSRPNCASSIGRLS